MVYVCPTCQEKTGRRTVSKYQKTTHAQQFHYPTFSFRIFCTLPSCNNPLLRLLVPMFVAIRPGTGTLPLRQPELHVPHPRRRVLHTSSLNMPSGLSVVRQGLALANSVLCICNVRPHAKSAGNFAPLFLFFFLFSFIGLFLFCYQTSLFFCPPSSERE